MCWNYLVTSINYGNACKTKYMCAMSIRPLQVKREVLVSQFSFSTSEIYTIKKCIFATYKCAKISLLKSGLKPGVGTRPAHETCSIDVTCLCSTLTDGNYISNPQAC